MLNGRISRVRLTSMMIDVSVISLDRELRPIVGHRMIRGMDHSIACRHIIADEGGDPTIPMIVICGTVLHTRGSCHTRFVVNGRPPGVILVRRMDRMFGPTSIFAYDLYAQLAMIDRRPSEDHVYWYEGSSDSYYRTIEDPRWDEAW